ncbi:MAG: DUF5710 domain-containing protein [Massilia sp.]|uniref:DUF5710 domain-containing protein n=1 Tax=Massilia sp. TaxID=1882437 RepID=UPI002FC75914
MVFLTVPYAEKDAAKALGARWNPTRRRWYVADGVATEPFAKWIDAVSASASTSASASAGGAARPGAKAGSGRVDSYQGKTVVGVNYVALDHDCNPLEECPSCMQTLEGTPWWQARTSLAALVGGMPGTSNIRTPGKAA